MANRVSEDRLWELYYPLMDLAIGVECYCGEYGDAYELEGFRDWIYDLYGQFDNVLKKRGLKVPSDTDNFTEYDAFEIADGAASLIDEMNSTPDDDLEPILEGLKSFWNCFLDSVTYTQSVALDRQMDG